MSYSYYYKYHKELTPEEYQYCIENIDKEECKLELFCSHIKLAIKIANKFRNKTNMMISYEDIESIAMYALWHAIELFDPSKEYKITSYAYPAISRAILSEFRNEEKEIDCISIDVKDGETNKELNLLDTIKVHYDKHDKGTRLEDVIERVFPDNSEDAYILRRILLEDAKQTTVADEMHVTRQCVSVRYHRLKKKLKKFIIEKDIDIEGE